MPYLLSGDVPPGKVGLWCGRCAGIAGREKRGEGKCGHEISLEICILEDVGKNLYIYHMRDAGLKRRERVERTS